MPNKQIYDTMFRHYFNDKTRFLSLGNAITDTDIRDTDAVKFNTLEGTFYTNLKNDISCLFGDVLLFIIEHQSTMNENIAFRMLCYAVELYQQYVANAGLNMYKPRINKLPKPCFAVIYEGKADEPPVWKLPLSKAFGDDGDTLELIVTVYNIHSKQNNELIAKCDYLRQYAVFSEHHRTLRKGGMSGNDAIRETIKYCRENNIMTDYLNEHESEVFRMVNMEWDAEKVYQDYLSAGWETGWETGWEDGWEKGRDNGWKEGRENGWKEGRENGWKEGRENGTLDSLKNLIKNANLSPNKAMNILGIPEDQQAHYATLLG